MVFIFIKLSAFYFLRPWVFSLSVFPQPEKPSAGTQFRSITVVSQPDDLVWLDGVRLGKNRQNRKRTIKTVSAGAHTIRLVPTVIRKDAAVDRGSKRRGQHRPCKNDRRSRACLSGRRTPNFADREKSAEAYRRCDQTQPELS